MNNEPCQNKHLFRVWPAHGVSFEIYGNCIHQHMPAGDWSINIEGAGENRIVMLAQRCGTVIVDETAMKKDEC